jgi:hypothetical protein
MRVSVVALTPVSWPTCFLLCNQLIDATKLAEEWKTDYERLDQQQGVQHSQALDFNGEKGGDSNPRPRLRSVSNYLWHNEGLQRQAKVSLSENR